METIIKESNGRRVFYIDVGNMPVDKALKYVDLIRKTFAK